MEMFQEECGGPLSKEEGSVRLRHKMTTHCNFNICGRNDKINSPSDR